MTEANPYVLMGVGQAASKEEIHDAYRKLAKRYHPDLNPGDAAAERSFKEIGAAYELLSDALERARFDREFSDSIANGGPHGGAASDATAEPVHANRSTGTAPRWHATAEPFEFRRARTVKDTGFDPDKGYEIAEPDDRGRLLVLALVIAVLISLVVELLHLGPAWRSQGARVATPFHINPVTILVGIAIFVTVCGAFIAWIMNGVERRARRNDAKRG
jgi:DnaJ-like protein